MRNHQAIVLLLMMLVAQISETAPQNVPQGMNKDTSEHLHFVRQVSSAKDVQQELHPIVNRSLDIIAGTKDPEPTIDALQEPYSITTDSSHRIFITDTKAAVVHTFDFVHSKYSLLGRDRLRRPLAVAADREGDVYVSDRDRRTIFVYDSSGKFVRYLKKFRGHESYFESPWGIAVDPVTDRIYVCDSTRHMVIVLDETGHVLTRFGTRGGGREPGEFRSPTQIAISGTEVAVLDTGNSRVQILDAEGHFLREIRLPGTSNGAGLAMDSERSVYVTDPELNHLMVFNRDGKRMYDFGESGNQPGQFNGISGIWIDSGDCLYVVDTQNKRVQLFQINGSDKTGRQQSPGLLGWCCL